MVLLYLFLLCVCVLTYVNDRYKKVLMTLSIDLKYKPITVYKLLLDDCFAIFAMMMSPLYAVSVLHVVSFDTGNTVG